MSFKDDFEKGYKVTKIAFQIIVGLLVSGIMIAIAMTL